MKKIIDYLMKYPTFYILVQNVVNGSGHRRIKGYLKAKISNKDKVLDQGCGTGEYSLLFKNYTGLDDNPKDIDYAKQKYAGKFILGDATNMIDIKKSSFDVVFSVGLHHHLSDQGAKKAIKEALRVTKKGGRIIIIDACWPVNWWNIYGLILRKLDRGGFVRHFSKTLKLLPKEVKYDFSIISAFPLDFIVVSLASGFKLH